MLPNYFWTSDTHFNHSKIIEYSTRPFKTVEEMNEALISNWNSVVKKSDIVYHLGDFGFTAGKGDIVKDIKSILQRLNGSINLILGNHDCQNYNERVLKLFCSHTLLRDKTINGQRIIMLHYAMRTWPGQHKGSWNLYAHSHGNLPDDLNSLSIDVGVDCHNYTPISFEQVKEIMSKKTYKPLETHRA